MMRTSGKEEGQFENHSRTFHMLSSDHLPEKEATDLLLYTWRVPPGACDIIV